MACHSALVVWPVVALIPHSEKKRLDIIVQPKHPLYTPRECPNTTGWIYPPMNSVKHPTSQRRWPCGILLNRRALDILQSHYHLHYQALTS